MRNLTVVIVILALCTSATAQEKSDTDPTAVVQKLLVPYREAFLKKDAAALSGMFAVNGIWVTIAGTEVHGRAQVEQAFNGVFKQMGDITAYEETVDHAEAMGQGIWAIGHAVIKGASGLALNNHWTKVYVPEGSDLKIGLLNIGVNVPPPSSQAKQ
jgi:uncharacterized protein (TIGR02246 family)